jgi:hypothetical protein
MSLHDASLNAKVTPANVKTNLDSIMKRNHDFTQRYIVLASFQTGGYIRNADMDGLGEIGQTAIRLWRE